MDKILIPLIRKAAPSLIASELVSVQPMADDTLTNFLSIRETTWEEERQWLLLGDVIHDFVYGWMVYDGDDYIPVSDFIHQYGESRIIKY